MVVLASSEEDQRDFLDSFGYKVRIKDDLAEDYGDLVECMKLRDMEDHFSADQLRIITAIDHFFDHKSGDADPDFWLMETPSCLAGWAEIRAMAKDYLALEAADEPFIFEGDTQLRPVG